MCESFIWNGAIYPVPLTIRGGNIRNTPCISLFMDRTTRRFDVLFHATYRARRTVGQGRINIRFGTKPVRRISDLDGKIINGPDPDPLVNADWRVVDGSDIEDVPYAVITVSTAYSPENGFLDLSPVFSAMGAVNSMALPASMGNFAPGTVKMMGQDWTHIWETNNLWYADIVLYWKRDGWLNDLRSQQFVQIPFEVPIMGLVGSTYTSTGKTHTVLSSKPGRFDADGDGGWVYNSTTSKPRRIFKTDPMNFLRTLSIQ